MHKEYYGGNIPWLKTGDLNDGIITSIPEYITEEGLNNSSAKLNPKGSVLIAMYGATIGKIGILGMPATTNQACCACINYEGIIQKYLFYFLLSHKEEFIALGGGGAQPNISKDIIVKTLIPIPPIKEQERILSQIDNLLNILETLDTNKYALETSISQAKSKILDLAIHGKIVPQDASDEPASELLKRINPKAVASCDNPHYEQVGLEIPSNWLISSLSEICDNINGLWTGKKPPFVKVGVIRNANFTKDFRLDYSKIEYIEVEEKSFEKRHLLNGDIIVEKSGGSDKNPVGRAILYEGADKQFSYSNFTMALRIRNHSCVYSKYLYYYLMAIYIRGDMRKLQTQTTGLHNLILDSYLSMPIYLPPFEEQKRIVNKIDELFKSLEAIAITLR